ncbi:MAG: ArsR family transcriptional regulator, partial [Pseudomonadota bacterium]|nr:ArsR family transcriptional regulator [Pseudomonadota bacterium]
SKPALAVAEAARVLRPGGRLLLSSLGKHAHAAVAETFAHVNLGFTRKELQKFIEKAGLELHDEGTVTRERRPPHFEVIALIGFKP